MPMRTLFLLITLLAANVAMATEAGNLVAPWREGEHYATLPVPVAADGEKVVVTEFFSYACIHCFQFDPEIEAWLEDKPADVEFERVPAVFNRQWELFAKAYYVARACDVLDVTHTPLFRAIHLDRRRFTSPADVASFYAQTVGAAGVDDRECTEQQDFLDVFDSFGVGAAVQQSVARGRAYQASGVPTMIVDGTWRTDGRAAGSNEAMLDVVDHLVRRARAAAAAEGGGETAGP
jgi:thiol:disulfide interchange protein DsbA